MKKFFRWPIIILAILVFPATVLAAPFINEIHYDNTGADTGEGIEIAGISGTDLTGWIVLLYNGTDGGIYDEIILEGIIPNQQNGYGTLAWSWSGIQNGAPDGMALVNPSNEIEQFISYEGTFVGGSGPATGILSIDIGIFETTSTPVGYSLQLNGTGSIYSDFTWSAATSETFGGINSDQSFIFIPIPGSFCFLGMGLIGLIRFNSLFINKR